MLVVHLVLTEQQLKWESGVFNRRKCLTYRFEDLQNVETGHPPAVSGDQNEGNGDGTIGTSFFLQGKKV